MKVSHADLMIFLRTPKIPIRKLPRDEFGRSMYELEFTQDKKKWKLRFSYVMEEEYEAEEVV